MNKQELKHSAKQRIAYLQNSVLRVITQFPADKNWGELHIQVAIRKLVKNPELPTDQVIEEIKRSYCCFQENWLIDKGREYISLTQEELDFNNKVVK